MREEQNESSGKVISTGNVYRAPSRESAGNRQRSLGSMIFAMERLLVTRVMRAFGNPPVQVVLWNGLEITSHQGETVARVLIRDRDALMQLVVDPELHFGELYAAQRIEVQGNLLEFLEAVYRVWPLAGQSKMDMLLATIFTRCGSMNACCTPAHIFRHRTSALRMHSLPSWIMSAANCGCSRETKWWRRAADGARWRCTWPGIMERM
jgi:hypothetical protein